MDGYGTLVCMDGPDATRRLSLEFGIRITVRRCQQVSKRLGVHCQAHFLKPDASRLRRTYDKLERHKEKSNWRTVRQ